MKGPTRQSLASGTAPSALLFLNKGQTMSPSNAPRNHQTTAPNTLQIDGAEMVSTQELACVLGGLSYADPSNPPPDIFGIPPRPAPTPVSPYPRPDPEFPENPGTPTFGQTPICPPYVRGRP